MIDKHMQKLLTVEGFIERYMEMLPDYWSGLEAYNAAEKQHEMTFGKRKYSDYDTFRVVLSRYNKSK